VLQRLGGGGMGEVYLAEDTRLGRHVALKRPSETYLAMPDARGRLHREAAAAGRLTHPNIAAIYDVLDVDSQPYIVMEYVEGESLANVLRRGPLPMDRAITVATEIVEALSAAHGKGIIHRDLKPANISLTPDGHAKVLDFGLAKGPAVKEPASSGISTITVPGQAMGTPGYSSPEQLVGAPADARDDIYSLGVVLFELLTGRRPFEGNDSLELAMATMTKTAPPVHQVNPVLPETLSPIVARAMARDRDDRYQSAEELRTDLRRFMHVLSTDVTHLIDSGSLLVAQRRRRRYVAGTIAAIAVILAAGIGLWWKGRSAAPGAARPPVLGVKAFVNNSGESDTPLAAGMRDLLITELANTPGLVLLSRTTIDESARQHEDPRQLSRDLDATHLLETTVRRSGPTLTLSVTLLRGDSGVIVWNDAISGPDTNLPGLPRRIADGVRRALLIPTAAAEENATSAGTSDVLALTHYGRAAMLLERPDVPGNLSRAEALLRSAVQRDGKFALAWARLGDTYWENYKQTGDTRWVSQAIDATNTALTLDQRQPEVWISLALIHQGTGREAEALSDLTKALSLQPTSDAAHQVMGQVLQSLGRRDEAADHYHKAIALRPDYWRHYSLLGAFYYSVGRYQDAVATFTRVTELAPDNARGFHNLGAVYYRIGDNRNALINYEKALAINPMPETRSAIGNVHYDEKRYDAALAAFLQAAKDAPNDGVLRGNVGDAYARLNRRDEARQAWREAITLEQKTLAVNPSDANTLARIALWEAKLGERADAEGHITRALTLAAGDAEVVYYSAVVRALAGDSERALTSLEQAVKNGYSATTVERDRDLDTIRNTPRFRALVSAAGK
jgi:serine/threonine protein kinase/tetratricopeptide (TPR) repeat protein